MTAIRKFALFALFAIVGIQPLAADLWTRPAKTPDTDVTCSACPDTKGKKSPGYPSSLGTYVGRYLDSEPVIEWQQPFRAARARNVVAMPSLNRLYFIIGSAVAAYDLNRFVQRVGSNEAMVVPAARGGSYSEQVLRWDAFFYAEYNQDTGWKTPTTDGYQRLYGIDVDDQGYVYMAYSYFGWGIAKDPMTNKEETMKSQVQLIERTPDDPGFDSTLVPADVQPKMIAALKSANGSYYAVISDNSSSILSVYDVSNRTHPSKLVSVRRSMLNFAKNSDATKIGIVTSDGRFELYTTEALVSGGNPIANASGPGGAPVRAVACDGTNFYIASDASNGLVITTFTGSGSKVADFPTSRPTLATQNLRWGDGYLVQSGITDGSSELRLFKAQVNDVSEVDLSIPSATSIKPYYFKNFYIANNSGRQDYTAPPLWGYFWDSAVVKSANKSYLIVTGMILGDVYEVKGSDSLTVRSAGSTGGANPNRVGTSAGPFYGDPVGFTATTSGNAQTNITWDFGNPEAATIASDPNTGPGLTGTQISHRYSGLTSPTSLPTTRTVTATSVGNANVNGAVAVTLAKPSVSAAVKNVPNSALPASGAADVPIVVGDSFVDTSDGSVQSHFDSWTIDATSTNALPNESVGVGACSASHTLAMTAHYGPYTGTSPNETSLSDMPIGISGITYSVRPFVAAIGVSATATDITFSSASRFTADTTVLSAAQINALTYKFDLLDANNNIIQVGPNGTGQAIASFTVAKSLFTSRGIRARLIITSPTAATGGCAGLSMETSTAFTQPLNGPDPALNGDCTNGGPPCSFNVSSSSGVNQTTDGWNYAWSVSPTAGVIFSDSASRTFTPTFTVVGSYTVSVTVTNAISSKTVAKTVSVTTVGSVCPTMVKDNNVFMFYQGDNCTYVSPNSACSAGKAINFAAAGFNYPWNCSTHTFTWNWGDGSPNSSGQNTTHTFNGFGTYNVTLTIANNTQSLPITLGVPVGNVVVPPPVVPPPVNPPPVTPPVTPPPAGCGVMNANANVFIQYQTANFSCSYVSTAACPINDPIAFTAASFGYDFTCGNHSYLWTFGDGTTATTRQASHAYTVSNTYTVTLSITNPNGQQVNMQVPVKVGAGSGTPNPPTPPPVTPPVTPPPSGGCGTINNNNVFITYTGATSGCSYVGGDCSQNEELSFNVAAFGYDLSCATHTFSWDFNDGTDPGSGRQVTHRYAGPGTYNVKVNISVNGVTTPISAVVKVTSGGSGGGPTPPPSTGFPFDFTIMPRMLTGAGGVSTIIPGEYVFTAIPVGDATTAKYNWDFGDGSSSSGPSAVVNHAYGDSKDHTITLTVQGYSGNVQHTLSPPRRRSAGH